MEGARIRVYDLSLGCPFNELPSSTGNCSVAGPQSNEKLELNK